MQPTLLVATGAALVATSLCSDLARAEVVETRELEQSLPVAATVPLVVIVRNISGSIRVTGHDRDTVEMRATETIRGDLQADIERARAEIELVPEQEPGRIAFRVRRRGANDADCNCRWHGWDGYTVAYDIELEVPRAAATELATVDDGEVAVEGMHGSFTLSNVNGAVRLTGARGSGSISTVNGDVGAAFERAPREPTSLKTVNGSLDVTFPATLAADLELATLNGDVYTDFDVAMLDAPPSAARNGGRFVMRSNRNSAFRVGTGGPRHSFTTVNGNIYVRKANP
jgi:hypothetical protein